MQLRLVLLICCISASAHAGMFDVNLFYFSDALTATTSSTNNRTFYDLYAAVGVDHGGNFLVGWNYAGYSTSDGSGSTSTTYSSSQMGPKFAYFFDRAHTWRLGAAYNLVTTTSYQNGSSASESWQGTGYAADLAYYIPIGTSFVFGTRLNYSSSAFTSKLIGSTYSTVSYSRTFIYPSLTFGVVW